MLGATYVKRHPRTGGYYFRRRVPDHFKPTIGTVEIIRSLATKCLSEAKRLSRPLADATDALFDEAEGWEGSGETVSQPAGWHSKFIANWLEGASGRRGDAAPASAPIIVSLPPEAPPPPPVQQIAPQPQIILPPQRIATVRDVFDRYLSEFERRTRTEQAWRRHVEMFLELSGLTWEANIHTVNDAHVEDFNGARPANGIGMFEERTHQMTPFRRIWTCHFSHLPFVKSDRNGAGRSRRSF